MTKYEKYQLQWLIEHNHSINELIKKIGNVANTELSNDGGLSFDKIIDEAFDIFQNEVGFSGSEIWVCEDEFLKNKE